jgi:hypothetical protein
MAVVGGLKVIKVARRVVPIAAEMYRRWNNLSPAEKERYKKRARQYGERGRDAGLQLFALLQQQQQRRGKRR